MMKMFSLSFTLFSLLLTSMFPSTRRPATPLLAIIHVTVIDATGAEAAPDQTVIIKGDRISSIGRTGEVAIPKDASTVDTTGKFLIPGLWDMHVHTLQKGRPELFFPLFIASGVTGVRDMGSPGSEMEGIRALREGLEDGKLLGPRIIAAGPVVDGPSPMFPELSIAVAGETIARQVVNDLKNGGADFIKVYSLLGRESYFAIADEARRRNIPFAGHVPESVSAAEASDAGQRSIEHLSGVRLACSTGEIELRAELIEARAKADASLLYRALRHVYTKSRETYSEEKAEALFARFGKNDTWQVPTLVVARFVALLMKSTYPSQHAVKARLQIMKALENNRRLKGLTADDFEVLSATSQNAFDLVTVMRRAGVRFMAGTDAPNPFVIPGRSLHDELELLVQAGFTPMEALQSATRNPAIYLGKLGILGTIEPGKIADVVLLEANPLEDINNIRKIVAVVIGGKFLPQARLDEISKRTMVEIYQLLLDRNATSLSAAFDSSGDDEKTYAFHN